MSLDANEILRRMGPDALREQIDEAWTDTAPKLENGHAEPDGEEAAQKTEIERLARLSPIRYDQEREAVAEKLEVRVSTLDEAVKQRRRRSAKGAKRTAKSDVDELQRSARHIINNSEILNLLANDFAKVIAGEATNGKLLYLIATSRLFDKTMNAAIKGTSAGGKSEIRKRVLEFFPPESVVSFTGLSEKALIYYDGDFAHKILSMGEAAATDEQVFQDYLLRELMSESRISYPTVQKVGGELVAVTIEKEGPVAFLVTTTKSKLHPENETRMLSLEIDDSEKQTRSVLSKVAQVEGLNYSATQVDYEPWRDFQRWLELGERRVVVPFAAEMVELIPAAAVRLRRDVGQVIRAIKAHALLHREQRGRDDARQIVADIEHDYTTVRELMNAIIAEGSGVAVNAAMAETIDAVTKATVGMTESEGASAQDIALSLKLDKSAAWRRLSAARSEGFVVNLELRKGMPGKYRSTGQKVEPVAILPVAATLAEKFRDTQSSHTPPESVQPRNRNEIADICLRDNGCTSGCNPVVDCAEPDARLQPVASRIATDKLLDGNRKSPPVARLQRFPGRYEAEGYDAGNEAADAPTLGNGKPPASPTATTAAGGNGHDDDLTIPSFLDRRHEICAQCARPGGVECAYDGETVRLHAHCQPAWIDAYDADRNGRVARLGPQP